MSARPDATPPPLTYPYASNRPHPPRPGPRIPPLPPRPPQPRPPAPAADLSLGFDHRPPHRSPAGPGRPVEHRQSNRPEGPPPRVLRRRPIRNLDGRLVGHLPQTLEAPHRTGASTARGRRCPADDDADAGRDRALCESLPAARLRRSLQRPARRVDRIQGQRAGRLSGKHRAAAMRRQRRGGLQVDTRAIGGRRPQARTESRRRFAAAGSRSRRMATRSI